MRWRVIGAACVGLAIVGMAWAQVSGVPQVLRVSRVFVADASLSDAPARVIGASGTEVYGNVVGCTTAPAVTMALVRSGHMVTLMSLHGVACASNSTVFMVDYQIPKGLAPKQPVYCPVNVTDAGTGQVGYVVVGLDGVGVVRFQRASGGWTASGEKGIEAGFQCSWALEL